MPELSSHLLDVPHPSRAGCRFYLSYALAINFLVSASMCPFFAHHHELSTQGPGGGLLPFGERLEQCQFRQQNPYLCLVPTLSPQMRPVSSQSPPSTLTPGKHQSAFSLHAFAVLGILHKWDTGCMSGFSPQPNISFFVGEGGHYHLSHSSGLLCVGFFQDRIL
jgi:hypothetical protein